MPPFAITYLNIFGSLFNTMGLLVQVGKHKFDYYGLVSQKSHQTTEEFDPVTFLVSGVVDSPASSLVFKIHVAFLDK